MKTFREYLIQNDYAKGTVKTYVRSKELFVNWCDAKDYSVDSIDYKSCLEYVKYLQQPKNGKKAMQKKSAKLQVGAIKTYFNFLIDEHIRFENPMLSINLRGIKRTLNHNLLDFEELEELYVNFPMSNFKYPNCSLVASRNKVITGLMMYQGLNATALKTLKVEHIDIEKGTIYIPSTRSTNSRKLELKSLQIVPLLRYLEQDRELLQDKIKNYTESLFPLNTDRFGVIIVNVMWKLKTINYKVINLHQIRASVITHWFKNHNIREVQYMIGHRYISSTERYLQDDLNSLHEHIENLHPIS